MALRINRLDRFPSVIELSPATAEKDTGEWQIAAPGTTIVLTWTLSGTPKSHLEPLRRAP